MLLNFAPIFCCVFEKGRTIDIHGMQSRLGDGIALKDTKGD